GLYPPTVCRAPSAPVSEILVVSGRSNLARRSGDPDVDPSPAPVRVGEFPAVGNRARCVGAGGCCAPHTWARPRDDVQSSSICNAKVLVHTRSALENLPTPFATTPGGMFDAIEKQQLCVD